MRLELTIRVYHKVLVEDFNSIKVRLELEYIVQYVEENVFQFHKGAIRTLQASGNLNGRTYFNSIKVRLELRTLKACPISFGVFQFHKGAIRTPTSFGIAQKEAKFQFHKGAIRTR